MKDPKTKHPVKATKSWDYKKLEENSEDDNLVIDDDDDAKDEDDYKKNSDWIFMHCEMKIQCMHN